MIHQNIPKNLLESLKNYKNEYESDLINMFLYDKEKFHKILIEQTKLKRFKTQKEINNYIDERIKKIKKNIISIDKTFDLVNKSEKELILYRGINYPPLMDLKKNEIITFPNYLSTSLSKDVALDFINGTCCLMKIILPKNSKYIYMEFSKNIINSEFEVLLPRNSKLKFIKRKTMTHQNKKILVFEFYNL